MQPIPDDILKQFDASWKKRTFLFRYVTITGNGSVITSTSA